MGFGCCRVGACRIDQAWTVRCWLVPVAWVVCPVSWGVLGSIACLILRGRYDVHVPWCSLYGFAVVTPSNKQWLTKLFTTLVIRPVPPGVIFVGPNVTMSPVRGVRWMGSRTGLVDRFVARRSSTHCVRSWRESICRCNLWVSESLSLLSYPDVTLFRIPVMTMTDEKRRVRCSFVCFFS